MSFNYPGDLPQLTSSPIERNGREAEWPELGACWDPFLAFWRRSGARVQGRRGGTLPRGCSRKHQPPFLSSVFSPRATVPL